MFDLGELIDGVDKGLDLIGHELERVNPKNSSARTIFTQTKRGVSSAEFELNLLSLGPPRARALYAHILVQLLIIAQSFSIVSVR